MELKKITNGQNNNIGNNPVVDKKDPLGFLGMFKKPALELLSKELTKNNVKSVVLVYDEKGNGIDAFSADFHPENINETIAGYVLQIKQMEHKLKMQKEQIEKLLKNQK